MANHAHTHKRKNKAGAGIRALLILAAVLAGLALVLTAGALLPGLLAGEPTESQGVSSGPVPTTTVATTTTTTTTAPTTTAAPTTTRIPGLDENGLLQFSTAGHYVQTDNYTDPKAVPWYLVLVNDWNPVPAGYDDSTDLTGTDNGQRVDSRIIEELNAMLQAGAANGIQVVSGYRASSKQSDLYWRQVQKNRNAGMGEVAAQTAAGQVVKRPGYSEHNCGLAVDLGGNGNFRLEEDFEETAAFTWLMENCADYGFILRFPKGKESVTGVIYEPWHYRYVGKEAAKAIMEGGLCLEEYLEQKGQ